MDQVIKALKDNYIIDSQNVKMIKSYIQQKYPYDSSDKTASIFADAIHKIIDHNISHFDELSRVNIKKNLLKSISQKKEIEINAFEVLEACTQLYKTSDDFFEKLTNWINDNQQHSISVEDVSQLTDTVKRYNASTGEDKSNTIKHSIQEDKEKLIKTSIEVIHKNNLIPSIIEEQTIDYEVSIKDDGVSLSCTKRHSLATQLLIDRLAILNENPVYYTQSNSKKKKSDINIESKDLRIDTSTKIQYKKNIFKLLKLKAVITSLLFLTIIVIATYILKNHSYNNSVYQIHSKTIEYSSFTPAKVATINEKTNSENHLPQHLQYKRVNIEALKKWLAERDSALADEPYFNSIYDTAKKYDINPLLMFAITGQEQGFVPKSNEDVATIVNNPFNVYGSWQDYNTDINDSTKIAAITILNLSKDCPEDEDPIKWINRKYAEDDNWHIGVSKIFTQLEKATTLKE